jgi:hypothetical protein
MSTEAFEPAAAMRPAAHGETRRALPSLGTYLHMVVALGRGSIRASLPVLAFAYFYHLGTELYLAFAMDPEMLGGSGTLVSAVMSAMAHLPLLILAYALILPIQDSILRGGRLSFSESVPLAVRRMPALLLSSFVQGIIFLGPPLLLLGGVGLFVRSLPSLPGSPTEVLKGAMFLALIPCAIYVIVMAILLSLAEPALILDSRGPFQSIGLSMRRAASHFGGLFGRFFVANLLIVLAMIAASIPIFFLQTGALLSGSVHPAAKVAQIIWESAVSAASLPFSVAAALVLYRSLQPAGTTAISGGTPVAGAAADATRRATSPFQFE